MNEPNWTPKTIRTGDNLTILIGTAPPVRRPT